MRRWIIVPPLTSSSELSSRYTTASFVITWGGKSDTSYLDISEVGEFLKELSYPRSHQVEGLNLSSRDKL